MNVPEIVYRCEGSPATNEDRKWLVGCWRRFAAVRGTCRNIAKIKNDVPWSARNRWIEHLEECRALVFSWNSPLYLHPALPSLQVSRASWKSTFRRSFSSVCPNVPLCPRSAIVGTLTRWECDTLVREICVTVRWTQGCAWWLISIWSHHEGRMERR